MKRVLILAAGQGTRLQPLTLDKPKCLVPLLGKTLLERQENVLRRAGITDIHIAAGYRADQITRMGYEVSINPRFDKTNMVTTLFSARSFIEKEGDLIIAYGDIVYQKENLDKLLSLDEEIVLMIDLQWKPYWELRMDNPLDDAETLMLDENSFVIELGKKPYNYEKIQGQYTGLIKVRADMITRFLSFYDRLDRSGYYDGKNFDNMYMTSLLQLMIDAGWKIKAAMVDGGWLEVDSVDDLNLYEMMSVNGDLDKLCKLD